MRKLTILIIVVLFSLVVLTLAPTLLQTEENFYDAFWNALNDMAVPGVYFNQLLNDFWSVVEQGQVAFMEWWNAIVMPGGN